MRTLKLVGEATRIGLIFVTVVAGISLLFVANVYAAGYLMDILNHHFSDGTRTSNAIELAVGAAFVVFWIGFLVRLIVALDQKQPGSPTL